MSSDRLGNQVFANRSEGDARQRMQFARQCFHSVESFLEVREARPTGHPAVAEAVADVESALSDYFDQAASLPALVQRDGLYDLQSEERLWDTATAEDVAGPLREVGIGLLLLRPGIATAELHRLLSVLDRSLADDLPFDPALDLDFEHVRLEWFDQSAVQLAGVGADLPPSDPTSVTRATHRLFEREFAERFEGRARPDSSLLEFFGGESRGQPADPSATPPPAPPDASPPSSTPDPGIQVQRAAMFRALLDEQPEESTRDRITDTAAAGIVRLVDNHRFDEARQCLETLRDGEADVGARLCDRVESRLDDFRLRHLAEFLAIGEAEPRRALLAFAHLLRSTTVTRLFASTIKWEIPDAAADDLIEYLERRSEPELRQLVGIVDKLAPDRAARLIEAAAAGLPETRSFLRDLLGLDIAPSLKSRALGALEGTWGSRDRALDAVSPLIGTPNVELRGQAIATIAEIAPEAVEEVLDPYVGESLARRSERDLENIVRAYAEYGGSHALRKLEDLIRVKRFANDQRRELAVHMVEVLADIDSEDLRTMFGRIADDWLVASAVRKACKSARNRTSS